MDIRVLGSLEVSEGGLPVELGSRRLRRLLAVLVVHANEVVSTDRLVDLVWGDAEPLGGGRTLKTNVSRLRSVLEPGRLHGESNRVVTRPPGYQLTLAQDELDASRFDRLVAEAARSAAEGDAVTAVERLDQALGLWRGHALAEFVDEDWARPAAARLEERRAAALEDRIDARLACGLHADAVSELEDLIKRYPLRDRLRAQLMIALYRSGRQAEALRAYQTYRTHLDDELGLDSSPELARLETRIVMHDPTLDMTATPGRPLRGYRLVERIGEGTSGVVYRAVQPTVGREIALKVIRPELANDAAFVRHFEFDAQAVSRLEHPHVVPLYDYWRDGQGAYLVMRWLRAGNAESVLARGPMPLADVRRVVEEIGGALDHAHRLGVIHGNVKPANVLFDEEGHAYLADFGAVLSPAIDCDRSYEAPAQRDGYAPDAAGDQYSLAQVVRALLTGTTARRGSLPTAVEAVLDRAAAADASARFPDSAAFVAEFAAATISTLSPVASQVPLVRLEAATTRSRNPYKGLRPFQEADAADFFGRDRLVDDLLARLDRPGTEGRLVAVVGPSGSGKSSLIRAGLVPRLRAGSVAGSADWFVATMLPGADPFGEFEAALLRIAVNPPASLTDQLRNHPTGIARAVARILPDDSSELLLVVDQLEELFTQVKDQALCSSFLDQLVAAVRAPHSRLRVIATLRADFYDRPLRHHAFGEMLPLHQLTVIPMTAGELEATITKPACREGVTIEPGLVATIVADVADHPAPLPLLQYALAELFETRTDDALTLAGYHAIGGVTGALARRADQIHDQLPPAARDAVRQVFTRIVTLGDGAADTRRRTRLGELASLGVDRDSIGQVIEHYGAARLLTFDRDPETREPTVEIAHEALITRWPRLAGWVDDDREGLRMVRHLTAAASAWESSRRDPGELYRGGRLETAEDWADAHRGDLTDLEGEFIDTSRAQRDSDARDERERVETQARQNRRLRRLLAGVGLALVIALVAGFVAVNQRESARRSETNALQAREAGDIDRMIGQSQGKLSTDRDLAMLLAVTAHRRAPSPKTYHAVQSALVAFPGFLRQISAGSNTSGYTSAEYSADGSRLVARRGTSVEVWDVASRVLLATITAQRIVGYKAAISPDGRTVAVPGELGGTRLVDVASGATITVLPHSAGSYVAAFSPDGTRLAVGNVDGAEVWDLVSQRVVADLDKDKRVEDITFSPSGRLVATSAADSTAGVWDAAGRPLFTLRVQPLSTATFGFGFVPGVAFDRAETRLAAASADGFVKVFDLADGHQIGPDLLASGDVLYSVAFLDDSTVGAIGSVLFRWRVPSGESLAPLVTQPGGGIDVSPDGTTLVLGGIDALSFWALDGRQLLADELPLPPELAAAIASGPGAGGDTSINHDGSRLVAASGGHAWWWNLDEPHPTAQPLDLGVGGLVICAFTADGSLLVTAHADGTVRTWDPDTFVARGPPIPVGHPYTNVLDVSRDGRWIALAPGGPQKPIVQVWDIATGRLVVELNDLDELSPPADDTRRVTAVSFSPDGESLAASNWVGTAVVWSTRTWKLAGAPVATTGAYSLAFSTDGRYLVTGNQFDYSVTLRDPVTHEPVVGGVLTGHTQVPLTLQFTPDGRRLLSIGEDAIRLWDLDTRAEIGTFPWSAVSSSGGAGSFLVLNQISPDGKRLTRIEGDHIQIWNLQPETWPDIACRAAGRNLTADEWAQFGPHDGYSETCPA